jgi:hypothetical protein
MGRHFYTLVLPLLAVDAQVVPQLSGSFTVKYNGYEYRTMMSGVQVTGSNQYCHPQSSGLAIALPSGYEIPPNTGDIVTKVVASYIWQCSVLVLRSPTGFDGGYPAYRTGASSSSAGQNFGDSQPKAVQTSGGKWYCPWTCYNILIRKPSVFDSTATSSTLCSGACSYASDGDCDVSANISNPPWKRALCCLISILTGARMHVLLAGWRPRR